MNKLREGAGGKGKGNSDPAIENIGCEDCEDAAEKSLKNGISHCDWAEKIQAETSTAEG